MGLLRREEIGPRAPNGARQEVKCFLGRNSPNAKSLTPGPWPQSAGLAARWEAGWFCGGGSGGEAGEGYRPAADLHLHLPAAGTVPALSPKPLCLHRHPDVSVPSVPTPGHSTAGCSVQSSVGCFPGFS